MRHRSKSVTFEVINEMRNLPYTLIKSAFSLNAVMLIDGLKQSLLLQEASALPSPQDFRAEVKTGQNILPR
jgi:hypothetical protein